MGIRFRLNILLSSPYSAHTYIKGCEPWVGIFKFLYTFLLDKELVGRGWVQEQYFIEQINPAELSYLLSHHIVFKEEGQLSNK